MLQLLQPRLLNCHSVRLLYAGRLLYVHILIMHHRGLTRSSDMFLTKTFVFFGGKYPLAPQSGAEIEW